jgi:CBS domain-containing protein
MTPEPKTLPQGAFAYDAALLMAEHGIRHVCVIDHGRLQGIVSERDLFHLQRIGLGNLSQAILHAGDLPTLKRLSQQIVQLTDQMLAQGAAVDQLVQIITTLNDHLTRRVILLCEEEHGPPDVAYTWLSFGSEGRQEQTLKTDQDNGMLFHADADNADNMRAQLLPLAERINHALAGIGFPLCPGNIMASNPECCLSVEEWRRRFARWIESGTPENLLKATIFFDFRPLHGDTDAVEQLRGWLLDATRKNSLFRRMLAENALRNRPPLGLLGDFRLARGGEHPRTLDLKVQGITPFVDAARIIALTHRISDTNTLGRLRSAAQRNALKLADVAAWSEAYQYIQLLRMRAHRDQAQRGEPLDNHIDPGALNELDQRILKEGFRQARKLQFKLSMEYQL